MKNNDMKIEQRMQNMKNFYIKVGEMIDKLPSSIPKKTREKIKDAILGDRELKDLMESIDKHRPPRFFLIGRTGVGKSSLINAMCNSYVASVGDTRSCTDGAYAYTIKDEDRVLMEILDTRGISESASLDENISAENMLIQQVNEFSPDVVIFMLNCTHKDAVAEDVLFLKKIAKEYESVNKIRLPIVTVVNKCDEMAPSRLKSPAEYSQSKIDKIEEMVKYYKEIIVTNGLKIDDIIAVSSLIDWQTPDGIEIDSECIDNLPKADIEKLQIAFDGRYHIEELLNILEKSILDCSAQMGLRMALRLEELVRRISKHLKNIFVGISATVALTPIPVQDIIILISLQSIMVVLIALLSGREISLESAKEFVLSMGGVVGAGFTFRMIAQQGSKVLNLLWPGAGSGVSAVIAGAGTEAIGEAAIAYYIDDYTLEETRKKYQDMKKKQE